MGRRYKNTDPWQDVVEADEEEGRGGLLGPDTIRRGRWWTLKLACGHEVERTVRYKPSKNARRGGTQWHRTWDDVLPHPKRVRCEHCGAELRKAEREDKEGQS